VVRDLARDKQITRIRGKEKCIREGEEDRPNHLRKVAGARVREGEKEKEMWGLAHFRGAAEGKKGTIN